jgi:hypothetical protein
MPGVEKISSPSKNFRLQAQNSSQDLEVTPVVAVHAGTASVALDLVRSAPRAQKYLFMYFFIQPYFAY